MSSIDPKHQLIYSRNKDNHSPEFKLERIHEVYFPFYECEVNVIAEKFFDLDRFSKIILSLVQEKVATHSEICSFLGVNQDSFLNSHFHYLIKEGYLEEIPIPYGYRITYAGMDFLNEKIKTVSLEEIEFTFYYNDLLKCFFLPNDPIDVLLASSIKRQKFSGYKLIDTRKIAQNDYHTFPHKNKPRIADFERSHFAEWFKRLHPEHTFYDFKNERLINHKRSVAFLVLEYYGEDFSRRYEVRRWKQSVINGEENELEEAMTAALLKSPELLKRLSAIGNFTGN